MGYATLTWALGPDGTLHLVDKGPAGIAYQQLTLSRDANNNITGARRRAQSRPANANQGITYSYDKLYRLTQENAPEGLTTYSYDPVGNRTTRVRSAATDTYSYDQADRIQSVATNDGHKTTTVAYVVNNAGNEVSRGHDYFLFDQANRMTKSAVRQPTRFAYNGDGLVVQSNVGTGPFTTRVWDTSSKVSLLLFDGNRK